MRQMKGTMGMAAAFSCLLRALALVMILRNFLRLARKVDTSRASTESGDVWAAKLHLYEIERQDASSMSGVNATVTSVALAYIAALSLLLADPSTSKSLGLLYIATPFPALALNYYISFQTAANVLRRRYLTRLESEFDSSAPVRPRFQSDFYRLTTGKTDFVAKFGVAVVAFSPIAVCAGFTAYVISGASGTDFIDPTLVVWAMWIYIVAIAFNLLIISKPFFKSVGG
jgi:hypothetical protein